MARSLNENCDIEYHEGWTEEHLDKLPEGSDGTMWNVGCQNEHYKYLSDLATNLYDDKNR